MSDTEHDINSSPIAIRDDGILHAISSKPSTHQKKSKIVDDDEDDIALWSEAKRQSWAAINTNPNAFYYRHCAPGEKKRNGAWDPHEKKLFLETMKVHPPSQGKWGLFAQHIPGRVGYQCRNYYHRLLESGEVKALPEEIEKMQRSRKKKSGPSTEKHTAPKVKLSVEDTEQSPSLILPEEKESSQSEDDEEVTLAQVKHLKLFSPKIEQLKNSNEANLKTISFFPEPQMPPKIENTEFEILTYIDNDLPSKSEIAVLPQELEQEIDVSQIMPEDVEEPVVDAPLKWSPRMKEPWKTLSPESIQKLKEKSKESHFEYEASKILRANSNNPLNLLLFSVPTSNEIRQDYMTALRTHLAYDDQNIKDDLVRRYFQIGHSLNSETFVNYVIETAPRGYY